MKHENEHRHEITPDAQELVKEVREHIGKGKSRVEILDDTDHLNKEGKEISQDIYDAYLVKTKGNFAEMLRICRETESAVKETTANEENLKIIHSLRGKIVYNAHKNWVEQNADILKNDGAAESINIWEHSKRLKELLNARGENTDVYALAAKEKAREDAAIDKKTLAKQSENKTTVMGDIEKVMQGSPTEEHAEVWNDLKKKLSEFRDKLVNGVTRRKIVAMARTATLLGMGLSTLTGSVSAEKISKEDVNLEREKSNNTYELAAAPEQIGGLEQANTILEKYLSSPAVEIPITVYNEPGPSNERVLSKNEIIEQVLTSKNFMHEQDGDPSKLELPKGYEVTPENLVDLNESGVVSLYGLESRGGKTLESFLKFQELANKQLEEEGLNKIVVAVSGYRTNAEQQKLYDEWVANNGNDTGVAKPGESFFETGYAIHFMMADKPAEGEEPDYATLTALPSRIMKLAPQAGLGVPSIKVRGIFVSVAGVSENLAADLDEAGIPLIPKDENDTDFSYTMKSIIERMAVEEMKR